MNRKTLLTAILCIFLIGKLQLKAQEGPIKTDEVIRADFHDVIGPIRDFPAMTEAEFKLHQKFAKKKRNEGLSERLYPFAATALPKGPDPVWQHQMGTNQNRETVLSFAGQNSPYFPPDANGTAGPDHYMQTVNCTYAIWNKSGTQVVAPTDMNLLFAGVPGASYNDGDPLILYDDDADVWLAVEFSISGNPDRMLIAVSQSDDPTSTWDRWSFVMTGMPDYEKFGIWRDGYYMATNTSSGKDVYVFDRDAMLNSEASPQMVSFDNPWRPTTIDGFHTIMPLDNDGPQAPDGSPGMFITINDDAIGGGTDQLWIYELSVDWGDASNATFNRVQQLNVPAFDSNFGNSWENIPQQGTSQKLDAIPMILMFRAQYRNFGSSQTIMCMHTVDLDATNHAGIRWYELQKTTGQWSIRQQSTYGPDAHHRWMGSIAMNASHEIALGYSISSSTMKPGIRYTGQSATENALASGVLDIAETVLITGNNVQTAAERWGDYSNMSVEPSDDDTFWFTTEYVGSGGVLKTQIAEINFSGSVLTANFSGTPVSGNAPLNVSFTDLSVGTVLSWAWTFGDGGTSTQQNPTHIYNSAGSYTVSLTVNDASGSDIETKPNYIQVTNPVPVADFSGTPTAGNFPLTVTFTDLSVNAGSSWSWTFGDGGTSTQQNPAHTYLSAGLYTVSLTVTGPNGSDTEQKTDYITVVDQVPVAEFSATPTSGNKPLDVVFTDLSVNTITIWAWSFGDGNTSSQQNPSHTYQNAGVYSVSLTVTGPQGTDTELKTDYITVVEPAPIADFSGTPTSGNKPLLVTFTDLSINQVNTWAWSFGDGGTSTVQNPIHTYQNAGVYTIGLTVTGVGGTDSEVKTAYITVNETTPVAGFSGLPLTGEWPLDVQFTNTSTGEITSYSWDFGDGGQSTLQNPTYAYINVGLYTVSLTVSGPGGTDTEIKTNYIDVTNPPAPIADFIGDPVSGDAPLTVSFTDLTQGNVTSWFWDFGDRFMTSDQNPTHTYVNTGSYTITLEATGPGGSDTEVKTDYINITVGINENKTTYLIYPNPATDEININFVDNSNRHIELFDLSGKLMKEMNCEKAKILVDISTLKQGIYNLTITEPDQSKTQIRIVKQ